MNGKMLARLVTFVLMGATVTVASAQPPPAPPADTAAVAPATPPPATPPPATPPAPTPAATPPAAQESRVYYGGTVTFSFSGITRIGVFPMLGYKLTPKISGGVEAGYEYVNYENDQSAHNYGGSAFARYRLSPALYAHAEYQAVNYELFTGPNTSTREWVPFLMVGGGVSRMVGPRTAAYVEVLFDVLQDEMSPYESWDPVISVGVSVGF